MDRQRFETFLYLYLMDRGRIEPFEKEILWKLYNGETLRANKENQKFKVLLQVANRLKEIEYRIDNLPKISKVKVT